MIAIDPRQGCCTCVSERISELLDGELDAASAPGVAMHVTTCPACGRIACDLARVVAAVHRFAGASGALSNPARAWPLAAPGAVHAG